MDDRKPPYGQVPGYGPTPAYGQSLTYPQGYQYASPPESYPQSYQSNPQPYPQSYQSSPQPASATDQAQILSPGGFRPLSKEERAETARIALEASFSFDGYQVVRREFFSHKFDPTLTIRGNSIIFNNACISKLDRVVYVQVLINPANEKLVIRPCGEGARDAIRWCIAKDEKRKSRQISCGLFTAKLYEMMGWEALYRYKLQGSRITVQNEEIYIFDLTSTEIFLPSTTDSANPDAKPKRRPPVYPADWRDSFGLPMDEHEAATRVNLMEGYKLVDVSQKGRSEEEQMTIEMLDREPGEVTII